MKHVTITLYSFDELSEQAKANAVAKLNYINVDYNWWDWIYEDAEKVGIRITGFTLHVQGIHIEGKLAGTMNEAIDKIIQEHGEASETHKTALLYRKSWDELVKAHSDGINTNKVAEGKESIFDELADDMETQFLKSILENYHKTLASEYDYRTGEEAIKEAIEANEYLFLENGELAHCTFYTGRHPKAGKEEFHLNGMTFDIAS